MAVRTIKEGFVDYNKVFIGACTKCSAVIECESEDLQFKSEPAEGQRATNMAYVHCSYCNKSDVFMHEKNTTPRRVSEDWIKNDYNGQR